MFPRFTKEQIATDKRGDTVSGVKTTGRRAFLSVDARGFSLIELVITVTILTILTLGVMPLVKVSIKRQKEQQLRETLRQIRMAIDEFHRDSIGLNCSGAGLQGGSGLQGQQGQGQQGQQQLQGQMLSDPRSKVVISDCTIFGVDNPDHYPPDLDTLVNGVNVLPRIPQQLGGQGLGGRPGMLESQSSTKKKVYLRQLPIDPITGKQEWDMRSCYDPPGSTSWGGENVFDVRSKSKDIALNGERYSDW